MVHIVSIYLPVQVDREILHFGQYLFHDTLSIIMA